MGGRTLDIRFPEKAGTPALISLLEYVRPRRGGMFAIPDGAGRPPGSRAVDEYDRNTGGGAVLGFMPPRTPRHNQMGVLWREIKRAIADICFGGIDRMRTAMIRMLRRGEAAIISSLFRYVPGGHGLPQPCARGLRRVGMPRPFGLPPHRSAHLRPDGGPAPVTPV